VPARHVTIAVVYYLAAALAIGTAAAQPQEPKREVFLPAKEKGAIVVVLSGFSGPDWYRGFSSRLAELGYYVVLIDGKVVPIRPTDTRGQDGAANLRKVISEAQSAERAVAGKVALVGLSFGGGGVLLHGAPLTDQVSAVVAYYPMITHMGHDMKPLASKLLVPVLVLAGERDSFKDCCLAESMRALAAAAKAREFELVMYPEANHAFNLSGSRMYREQDATNAWERTAAFLSRHHPYMIDTFSYSLGR